MVDAAVQQVRQGSGVPSEPDGKDLKPAILTSDGLAQLVLHPVRVVCPGRHEVEVDVGFRDRLEQSGPKERTGRELLLVEPRGKPAPCKCLDDPSSDRFLVPRVRQEDHGDGWERSVKDVTAPNPTARDPAPPPRIDTRPRLSRDEALPLLEVRISSQSSQTSMIRPGILVHNMTNIPAIAPVIALPEGLTTGPLATIGSHGRCTAQLSHPGPGAPEKL